MEVRIFGLILNKKEGLSLYADCPQSLMHRESPFCRLVVAVLGRGDGRLVQAPALEIPFLGDGVGEADDQGLLVQAGVAGGAGQGVRNHALEVVGFGGDVPAVTEKVEGHVAVRGHLGRGDHNRTLEIELVLGHHGFSPFWIG